MLSDNNDKNKDDPHANDAHRLEDMEKRLYRRDLVGRKARRFDILHPRRFSIKNEWDKNEQIPKINEKITKIASHPSFFKKFFRFAVGFAILSVLFAVGSFFYGGNTVSNENISINVLGNSFAAGGEEVPLQVEVVNKNPASLELADLFMEYDKGGEGGSGAGHVRQLISLGRVETGKTVTKNIFVTLYGEEASIKNIDFSLQYRIAGSNAIFIKKSVFPVTISSAPLSLIVDGPKTLSPNQNLTYTVKVKSNSKNIVNKVLLRVEYPSGFKFASATPKASSFNNVWDLGDFAPGAERSVTVTGTVYGQDGEDRAFRVYAGAKSATDGTKIGVTYNSVLHLISLVKPFIDANLSINGMTTDTVPVSPSSSVLVTVNWVNNLPTQITDAEVEVGISGNSIDASTIVASKGFYNSNDQTIVWNRTTAKELGVIDPSDSGVLDFSFKVKPLWSPGQPLANSPNIKFIVSIKGKQSDTGGIVTSVTNFQQKTAVVSSDLGFSGEAFYTNGPFSNTGPIPPKAEQPTTYTVTWRVTNSANQLSGAIANATLPTYVDWVGPISPTNESVQYDATTRTVRWVIGQIPPGTGLSSAGRTVSFQVRLNPSSSQVGTVPKLVLDTLVSAQDTYTGEKLTTSRGAVTTFLGNDSGFPPAGHIVTN
ncbi:MAG: DUF11 domain-containing protein [Candidatus Pacebacteria bacterium]|nr:DUF11 domain-containing protein [Candidatus Paceibacterota bacterium]